MSDEEIKDRMRGFGWRSLSVTEHFVLGLSVEGSFGGSRWGFWCRHALVEWMTDRSRITAACRITEHKEFFFRLQDLFRAQGKQLSN